MLGIIKIFEKAKTESIILIKDSGTTVYFIEDGNFIFFYSERKSREI